MKYPHLFTQWRLLHIKGLRKNDQQSVRLKKTTYAELLILLY